MRQRTRRVLAAGSLFLDAAHGSSVDFVRDVEPVFRKKCYACHGLGQVMSGLRLDSREAALSGVIRGIIPGKSGESRLIQLVSGAKPGAVMLPVRERLALDR
jgi:hypothetical protein